MGLNNDEYKNEIKTYVSILCDNLKDNDKQVKILLRMMRSLSDDNVKTIVAAVKEHCPGCKDNEGLYEIVLQMGSNKADFSNDRIQALDELRYYFQPAKEIYGKKEVFSYSDFQREKKVSIKEEDECILSILETEGIKGALTFAASVKNVNSAVRAIHRNLATDIYFKVLDDFPNEEDHLLGDCLINALIDDEVIAYCNTGSTTRRSTDILVTHAISDVIIDYIDTLVSSEQEGYWANVSYVGCANLSAEKYEYMIKKTIEYYNYVTALHLIFWKLEKGEVDLTQIYSILELYVYNEEDLGKNDKQAIRYIIQRMLQILQTSNEPDIERIAGLEEKYIALLLPHEITTPKCIYQKMANNPRYALELIKKLKEQTSEGLSNYLYSLLQHFKVIPGTQPDGTLDFDCTMEWFKYALDIENVEIRIEMLDMFGKALFYVGADEDGFMIDRRIADFLEDNINVLRSFELEAYNSIGLFDITTESHKLEDIIAEYDNKAEECEAEGYINIANIFRNVSGSYRLEHEELEL